MRINQEQFENLGDYSSLNNLHVYGDLLTLYSLPIKATIAHAGDLFRTLQQLDRQILSVYVSYILARVGFYSEMLASDFPEELFTTKFNDEDWIENLIFFEVDEQEDDFEWELYFKNSKDEKMKIIVVRLLVCDENPVTGECDEATHLVKLLDNSTLNFVIIHPRLSRNVKKTFMKTKERMREITSKDIVLSTGQFISKFIADERKKKIVESNWTLLRTKILGTLQNKWRILVYAIHDQQLSDINDRLRKARLKLELGFELEDSVKEVGISCEGILQILKAIYPKKIDMKMQFADLLTYLRDIIIEDFGEDVYNDLDFIRLKRNDVVHPPVIKPDYSTALKVVTKAELFNELFQKWLSTTSRI